MIRLRFTSEISPISWIVKTYTWSDWSHVEIDVGHGYLGARPQGGVMVRPYNYLNPVRAIFAEIQTDDTSMHPRSQQVLDFCYSQQGKKYDWTAIFGIALHRDWRESDSWICSELVASAFEKAGMPLLNPDVAVNRLSPRDIALSPYVKFIP